MSERASERAREREGVVRTSAWFRIGLGNRALLLVDNHVLVCACCRPKKLSCFSTLPLKAICGRENATRPVRHQSLPLSLSLSLTHPLSPGGHARTFHVESVVSEPHTSIWFVSGLLYSCACSHFCVTW